MVRRVSPAFKDLSIGDFVHVRRRDVYFPDYTGVIVNIEKRLSRDPYRTVDLIPVVMVTGGSCNLRVDRRDKLKVISGYKDCSERILSADGHSSDPV